MSPKISIIKAIRNFVTLRPIRKAVKKMIRAPRNEKIAAYIERDCDLDKRTFLIFQHQFFDRPGERCYNGGAEKYVRDLADIITDMGYKAVLVQMGHNQVWERRVGNLQVIGAPCKNCADYVQIIGHFTRYSGVVYSGAVYDSGVYWANTLLHPNIMISHGITWDAPQANMNPLRTGPVIADVDNFVSVDTNTISWFRTASAGTMGRKRMNYIPNYVDTKIYKPVERHSARVKICFPRRASPERGYWLMSAALPLIMEKYPHCDFDFVGFAHGDQITNDLNCLIGHFPGRVRHYLVEPHEMAAIYQGADISLIPTMYAEGTSLSCLEAQACGNVVIATNIGGLPNLIIDGYNGLLINPDVEELMTALDTVLTNPELAKKLSANAVAVAKAFEKTIWESRWKAMLRKVTEK
jgi:glycosyltransferase involved in cell wall biosynthesis